MELFNINCPNCGASESIVTNETILGVHRLEGFAIEGGALVHEFDGNGTELCWDTGETNREHPYACRSCFKDFTTAQMVAALPDELRAQIKPEPVAEPTHAADVPALLQRCESFIAGFEGDELQDGLPDALLIDLRAAIEGKPAPLPELPNEAALITELRDYCAANDLPLMSADELIAWLGNSDEDDAPHREWREWLHSYVNRWDALEVSRRELREACDALGQAEGWALFNDDTSIQRDDEDDRFASDDDALAYVRRMAAAGSPVHAYALERLAAGKAANV